MRITNQTRFPHPVLSEETHDYDHGRFAMKLRVSESRTTGKVTVQYTVDLAEASVQGLLDGGKAMLGMFIVCRRTYYDELHEVEVTGGSIEFSKGELRGNVVFRPVVCAIQTIGCFSSPNLHAEYGGSEWAFGPSDVLAVGPEVLIDVGLDKLSPMETIFDLVENSDVPPGETQIQLDGDKISICADKETCKRIHVMRGTGAGRIALLNGVYLPAVMEVLASVVEDAGAFESQRWFTVFAAKCAHLGIDLEKVNVHADAQKLLRSPLGKLLKSSEFNSS